jgi:hypothetical protein
MNFISLTLKKKIIKYYYKDMSHILTLLVICIHSYKTHNMHRENIIIIKNKDSKRQLKFTYINNIKYT